MTTKLLEACRALGGCPTGEARITPGYRLRARWVIHTVGPVWRGGGEGEDELLARCYRNVLALTPIQEIRTIAFPLISTGAYGFPLERAGTIALREIEQYLAQTTHLDRVAIVCFGSTAYNTYRRLLSPAPRDR